MADMVRVQWVRLQHYAENSHADALMARSHGHRALGSITL
jgi:hypothetical protein